MNNSPPIVSLTPLNFPSIEELKATSASPMTPAKTLFKERGRLTPKEMSRTYSRDFSIHLPRREQLEWARKYNFMKNELEQKLRKSEEIIKNLQSKVEMLTEEKKERAKEIKSLREDLSRRFGQEQEWFDEMEKTQNPSASK